MTDAQTLAALDNGGRRVKVHDAQMVIKLPSAAKNLVKTAAGEAGVSESTIVRWALGEYLKTRGFA